MPQNGGMRVALALGSGGARGYAHIGVIDELSARGYEVVGVSGSSMGALVGGLHAAGKLDDFAEWARTLTQRAVLRLLDPSISAAGILRAEKILDAVREIIGEATIEELPIPYTAVATDLIAGKSVWLQRGPVDSAIRASIAIPGVIAPHVLNGRLLGDGGILDPLPMDLRIGHFAHGRLCRCPILVKDLRNHIILAGMLRIGMLHEIAPMHRRAMRQQQVHQMHMMVGVIIAKRLETDVGAFLCQEHHLEHQSDRATMTRMISAVPAKIRCSRAAV